jgi:hypothetical protein
MNITDSKGQTGRDEKLRGKISSRGDRAQPQCNNTYMKQSPLNVQQTQKCRPCHQSGVRQCKYIWYGLSQCSRDLF